MRKLSLKKDTVTDLTPAELEGVSGAYQVTTITAWKTECLVGYHGALDHLIRAMQSRECEVG